MLGDALERHSILSRLVNDGQDLDVEKNIREDWAPPPLQTTTAHNSSEWLKAHALRPVRWPLSPKSNRLTSSPAQSIYINIF
jgi:hypothetical protein